MKAAVVEQFGPPEALTFKEVADPAPGPHDVVVDVTAAGVGYVDGLLVQGLYQVKPPLPYVPGNEFAGVISAVGEKVTHLKVGQRVMGTAAGAYADKLKAPALVCLPTPDAMSDAIAAGFAISYATALYAWRDCGKAQAGETALVLGAAGGVGQAAIAVAKTMGLTVIAAASTDEKRAAATGAADGWRDTLKEMTRTSGLDLVYDPVGGTLAEAAMRSLSPGGRHLVVGFAAGDIPKVGLNIPLLKRCAIVGADWGGEIRANPAVAAEQFGTLLGWIAEGKLRPAPVTTRPMAELPQALRDQLDRKLVGKLVMVT
jgi:NADPH2:quinone reductase